MPFLLRPYIVSLFALFLYLLTACEKERVDRSQHYFLRGYDHLEFRNPDGSTIFPWFYISSYSTNGVTMFRVMDTTLTLYDTREQENYTGFIRTFDPSWNNLQGEFKDGKMYRLRYWDSNRILRMDADIKKNTGVIWFRDGTESIRWNEDERYSYYRDNSVIKSLSNDSATFHYDRNGDLSRYEIYKDSAFTRYYPNGQPMYFMSYKRSDRMRPTKSWHPNGQLKVVGQYINGRAKGVWIEYDSLGNEIKREEM